MMLAKSIALCERHSSLLRDMSLPPSNQLIYRGKKYSNTVINPTVLMTSYRLTHEGSEGLGF